MSTDRIIAIGINTTTRTVNSVGEVSGEEVLQMLRAGEIVLPATKEQCRTLWGMEVIDPYCLQSAVEKDTSGPFADLCRIVGIEPNAGLHRFGRAVIRLREKMEKPLDVVLHCPACKMQHIDGYEDTGWTNKPHRTHKCHGCGELWTAADTNTNGARAVKPGSSATWPAPDLTLFAADRLPARDQYGMVWHPDVPDIGEDEIINPYLWAIGFDCCYGSMEADIPAILHAQLDTGEPDCNAWLPSKPDGDGWLLAAIYDTKDGPHALFVRPFHTPTPIHANQVFA